MFGRGADDYMFGRGLGYFGDVAPQAPQPYYDQWCPPRPLSISSIDQSAPGSDAYVTVDPSQNQLRASTYRLSVQGWRDLIAKYQSQGTPTKGRY